MENNEINEEIKNLKLQLQLCRERASHLVKRFTEFPERLQNDTQTANLPIAGQWLILRDKIAELEKEIEKLEQSGEY